MTGDAPATVHRGGSSLTVGTGALPTPEQQCLVRAATGPASTIESSLSDWRAMVDLSGPIDGGSYRLLPTIFHRLQAEGIDDPNRGMIKGVYRRSMVEGTGVVHSTTAVLRALRDAGITTWVVKGAGLVRLGYYPTLAARPMVDVDVVVESSRRDDAIAALRTIGYEPVLSDLQMAQYHGAPFVDAAGHEIDLHWHHLEHARSAEADAVLTRGSVETDLNGVPVLVPGPTGLLIATLVHGMTPNPEPTVRWLVDAAMILDHAGDQVAWDVVVDFATRFRLTRRIERALQVLAEVTGHPAPEAVMTELSATRTTPVERLELRLPTAPWNSIRGLVLAVLAGYAGGDRELRHVVTGLPRYLAGRWDVATVRQVPAAGYRKLRRWMRTGPPA